VVVSDRACWAAAVTGRLDDPDPAMAGAFLSLGYPVGDATPFRGVRALGGDRELRSAGGRVTGGKDSRLVAAALATARVPFRARTHGFAGHPDVVVAGLIAATLGVEHTVTRPRPPGVPDEADVLGRLRAAVLVSDGMLSAFENVGRPDPRPASGPAEAGGHGGELLRGGYAHAAWRTPSAAAAPLNAAAAAAPPNACSARRRPTGRGPGHWPR
jgi:hypothetical protein